MRVHTDTSSGKLIFTMPDSNRSAKRSAPILADSLHLVLDNLAPEDTLSLKLYAVDSSGNINYNAMETVQLQMTDTTQPSKPVLIVDPASRSRNGFTVKWAASRDSVQEGDHLAQAKQPNFQIQKYRLTRILKRDSLARTTSLDRVDTTILIDPVDGPKTDTFKVEMRFLPPGTPFHLRLTAFDNSGFESITDTLTVRTDSVRFAGAESTLVCPKGFIPVPSGRFKLGDDASTATDERSAANVFMGPYCIEPYEHRDSTGKRFVSNVTYEQAAALCADVDTAYATQLCSEAEWERACEGPDSIPLPHGIQSEGKNPSILQESCNQGTNDSAMAMSFELRNALCLTTEGIYDMAGNLSEWVRDPYVPKAYSGVGSRDTLTHDFAFKDTSGGKPFRSIRGGNYLKTNFPQQSLTQNLARCSNRDFAQQVRPYYRNDCLSKDRPKIAVVYANGLAGHYCIDLPPQFSPSGISGISPNLKDSSYLLVFLKGQSKYDSIKLNPVDTTFLNKKPISARLTNLSLATVTFVSSKAAPEEVDTLDATEMKDTSQTGLERIFRRESGNSEWTVKKTDGRFAIDFLYAYSVFGTKPARPYYSSRVIGFRCCSLAKSVPAPIDTTVIATQ
jgi:hypothetical protein